MIAIVDYKAGNLKSVERALKHLGLECRVTSDAAEILAAERLIFPGVGAAGKAMETITGLGLDRVLRDFAASGRPFLGICLGSQIILDHSAEDETRCLGLIPGEVVRFGKMGLKIPQMGWNTIAAADHPVFAGIDPAASYYFVHSYYTLPAAEENVAARTVYGMEFASAVMKDNIIATQFHPEKSGEPGLKLLENFSRWDGRP